MRKKSFRGCCARGQRSVASSGRLLGEKEMKRCAWCGSRIAKRLNEVHHSVAAHISIFSIFSLTSCVPAMLTHRLAAGVRYLRSHKVMARESETYQRFLSWHSHCDPFFFSLHFLESRPTLRVRTYLWIQRKWIENKNEEIVARLAAQRASLRAQSDCHNFPFSLISSFSFLFPTGQQMDKEWMPVGEKKEKKKRWGKGLPLYFLFWTAQSKFLFLFFYYLRSGRSKRKENIKWQCACAYTFLCHPPNFFSLFFVLAGGQEV